jgi:predicted secreted protein
VAGAPGTETFHFTAEEAGEGELSLEYRRPWEEGVAAEDSWSVDVTVDPAEH